MENKLNNIFSYQVDYAITNNNKKLIENYLEANRISILVKYIGNLTSELYKLATIEEIGNNYAIITCNYNNYFNVISKKEIDVQELAYELKYNQEEDFKIIDTYKSYSCLSEYDETGENTIVGVIDSGIDYAHKEFRNPDGTTRIKYILDFSLEGAGFLNLKNGRVFTEKEINLSLETGTPLAHMDTIGHGTSVASICAGNTGVAKKATICFVKLSNSNTRAHEVLKGIYFLREVSRQLNMPLAVNLSMGGNNASHSGKTLYESYLDEVCLSKKFTLCIASGNEGNASHHKIIKTSDRVGVISNVSDYNIYIFIPRKSNISFFMEFDNGIVSKTFSQNNGVEYFKEDTFEYYVSYGELLSDVYDTFNIKISNLEFKSTAVVLNISVRKGNEEIHLYLPVLEKVGDDTYFGSSNIENTLTFPSTSKKVITVSAYDGLNESVAPFSGFGNTVLGDIKPNVSAPGVNIGCADSIYGYTYKTGTSFSTPIVTGICSLILEKNPDLTCNEIKALLEKSATRLKNIEYPNIAYGYGFVCYDKIENILNSPKEYVTYLVEDKKEILALMDNAIDIVYKGTVFDYLIVEVNKLFIVDFQNFLYNENIDFEKSKTLALTSSITYDFLGVTEVQKSQNLYGENVVVALIDTGISVKSSVFKDKNKTRVTEIYDIETGVTYNKLNIQNIIDNDLTDFDEVGHGSLVFSVATGSDYDNFVGIAPKADIICAKISETTEANKVFSFIDPLAYGVSSIDILKGLEYLLAKQRELDKPMVVGIPFSTNEGNHTIEGIFDRLIRKKANQNGFCVVTPTGNNGLGKKHISQSLSKDERNITYLNIDDQSTKLSIYTKKNANFLITLGNKNLEEISFSLYDSQTFNKTTFDYDLYVNFSNKNNFTELELGLTGFIRGTWYLEITPLNFSGNCEFYLPINPQSSLNTYYFSSKVLGSITIPGTINNVISVSGFDLERNEYYADSGASDFDDTRKIDVSAPCVNIEAYGINGKELVTGTSMSVATTMGVVALILEKHPRYDVDNIKKVLRQNAIRDKDYKYPNNLLGYGVLHLDDM